jgi:peptide/nickel transport system permease protein
MAGLTSALRRGSWLDTLVVSLANFGVSIPVFWLGILMVYLFSLYLGWLPVQGYTSPFKDFWLSTRQLIMPVICLCVGSLATNTRQTRSSMLEIIRQDYIRTAWSKGLKERIIVFRHVLKNGLIPVITLIGMQVSFIIGGSVLIETVFNIPGMGRLMIESVFSQDFPIVQGGCLVIATMVTSVNLFVDISYGWLDPRIRYN